MQMPTEVIDTLAGLSVRDAVFLALALFGSAACVWLLLVDLHLPPHLRKRAALYAALAAARARLWAVSALLFLLTAFHPAAASKKGANR